MYHVRPVLIQNVDVNWVYVGYAYFISSKLICTACAVHA